MPQKRPPKAKAPEQQAADRRESGQPGGGQGRRDPVERTGVYPPGAPDIPPDADVRMAGSWGGGDYQEAGGSELVYRDGQLLGGLTSGPSGEPTGESQTEEAPEGRSRKKESR